MRQPFFQLRTLSATLALALTGCSSLAPQHAVSEPAAPHPQERRNALSRVTGPQQDNLADAARHYDVAKYWLGQQRLPEALNSLNRVLEIDPSHVEGLNARASVLVSLADFARGRVDLDKALMLEPMRAHLHYNSALLHRIQGDSAAAMSALRGALSIEPAHQAAQSVLRELTPSPVASVKPQSDSGLKVVRIEESATKAQESSAVQEPSGSVNVLRYADPQQDAGVLEPVQQTMQDRIPESANAETAQHAALVRVPETAFQPLSSGVTLDPSAVATASLGIRLAPISALPKSARDEVPVLDLESLASSAQPSVAERPLPAVSSFSQSIRVVGATLEIPVVASTVPAVIAIAPQAVDSARIDVANGNGINGMARALRGQLRAVGVKVATISNWSNFSQPVTRVLYREGYEQAAIELAQRLPVTAELVAVPRLPRADRDVMVVLGRDMRNYRPTASGWENMAQVGDHPAA